MEFPAEKSFFLFLFLSFFARRFAYTVAIAVTKGQLLIAITILVFVPFLSADLHYMPYTQCFQRATLAILVENTRISGSLT